MGNLALKTKSYRVFVISIGRPNTAGLFSKCGAKFDGRLGKFSKGVIFIKIVCPENMRMFIILNGHYNEILRRTKISF